MVPVAAAPGDVLLAFTADGTAFPVHVGELPVVRTIVRGARPLALQRGQTLAALTQIRPEGGHLLLVTALGEIKRCEARSLATVPPEGAPAYDVPEGDRLLDGRRARAGRRRDPAVADGQGAAPAAGRHPHGQDGVGRRRRRHAAGAPGRRRGRHARPGRRAAAGAAPPRGGQGRAGRRVPRQGPGDRRRRERVGRHAQALARGPRAHRDRRAAGRRGAGRDVGGRRHPRAPGDAGALDARHRLAYRGADGRRSRGGRRGAGTMTSMPARPCVCDLHLARCDASCNRAMLEKTFYMAASTSTGGPAWSSAPGPVGAREDRGPAGGGRARSRSSRPRRSPEIQSSRARVRSRGTSASTSRPTSRAGSWSSPHQRHRPQRRACSDDAEARHDARQRRRRAAALQLHPPRDRAQRPDRDRDLDVRRQPGARQAPEAGDRRAVRRLPRAARRDPQRAARLGEGHVRHVRGAQATSSRTSSTATPDPIALLRAGDEAAVRELIRNRQARAAVA